MRQGARKMKNPSPCKYSILIPVYRVGEYIDRCLSALVVQITSDVQIILVDDGSPDNSGAICDRYAALYPQITVIHQTNGGVSAGRNRALQAATGEYLIWVDPDDYVSENWFSSICQALEETQADMLVFDYDEVKQGKHVHIAYNRTPGVLDKHVFLNDVVRDKRINSCLWNKPARRSLFDGIRFDPSLKCLEDYAILHHLILRAKKIVYLPVGLYYYVIRNDSQVRTLDLDVSWSSYQVALQRKTELENAGIPCDHIGIIHQAKGFCRNYYLAGMPREQKEHYQVCRKEIISNCKVVLCDAELSVSEKIKTLMASSMLVGKLFSWLNRLKK